MLGTEFFYIAYVYLHPPNNAPFLMNGTRSKIPEDSPGCGKMLQIVGDAHLYTTSTSLSTMPCRDNAALVKAKLLGLSPKIGLLVGLTNTLLLMVMVNSF